MIAAWLLYAGFVAVAAGSAALALDRAARALRWPTRLPWVVALTFSAVWPAWVLVRSVAQNGADDAISGAVRLPPVLVTASRDAVGALARWLPISSDRVSAFLLVAWLIMTTALLVRLLLGMYSVQRQRRSWTECEVDGVPVLLSPATGPAVVGILPPSIIVPEWTLALEPGLRQLVLRHELEHVRARDTALRLLGALLTALMPWNLALWWQADRLALAIEVDCDARVLRTDARRERYGLLLLAIAQRQSTPMLAPALSEPTSHLERRITAMQHSIPRRPALVAAGLAIVATISLALACEAPSPGLPTSPAKSAQVTTPNKPFVEFKLDKQATLEPGTAPPHYPDALRAQGKQGEVVVQFVVNPTGAVDSSTIRVLESTDPAFTAAVWEALLESHFQPAEVGGRKVRQLKQLPFVFRLQH